MKYLEIDNTNCNRTEVSGEFTKEISDLIINTLLKSNNGDFGVRMHREVIHVAKKMDPTSIAEGISNGYAAYAVNEEGKIIGFALIEEKEKIRHLSCLYVLKEFQREGIGSRLLQFCEDKMKALGHIEIHADAINLDTTIEFYVRKGFIKYGRTGPSSTFMPMSKSLR